MLPLNFMILLTIGNIYDTIYIRGDNMYKDVKEEIIMNEYNKRQIAEITGYSYTTIKRFSNERIVYELAKHCKKVIEIKPIGRSIVFVCEYEEYNMTREELLKEVFNVFSTSNFSDYSNRKIKSIEDMDLATRREICDETNTSVTTSEQYDKKLKDNGVIVDTKEYVYVCVDRVTRDRVITTEEAYNRFWHNNGLIKSQMKDLSYKRAKGFYTDQDYNYLYSNLESSLDSEYIYYKLSKFVVEQDNYLTKLIKGE